MRLFLKLYFVLITNLQNRNSISLQASFNHTESSPNNTAKSYMVTTTLYTHYNIKDLCLKFGLNLALQAFVRQCSRPMRLISTERTENKRYFNQHNNWKSLYKKISDNLCCGRSLQVLFVRV